MTTYQELKSQSDTLITQTEHAKLHIVRIPGLDDVYAAPSHRVALLMQASHNKWAKQFLEERQSRLPEARIDPDYMLAVIEEEEDPEYHAELLEEFSYADWGITEADLNKPEDESQAQLFQQEGGAA